MKNDKVIKTGPKGGQYWEDEQGKKHYIKKGTNTIKSVTIKETNSSSYRSIRNSREKVCCCCGKTLRHDECEYYDLTDYCPKCALADGIITSLE